MHAWRAALKSRPIPIARESGLAGSPLQNPAQSPFLLGSRVRRFGFHFPSRPPLPLSAGRSPFTMARRRRRVFRGRVPPDLHRAYGALARTLGHAVLSLIPPPTQAGTPCSACRGRGGAGCLACRRWEYLLRDGDPVAYRSLITRAVCAVAPSGSAPPPPLYTPGNGGHSQAKVLYDGAFPLPSFHFLSCFVPTLHRSCLLPTPYLRFPPGCLPACYSTFSSLGWRSSWWWWIGRVRQRTSSPAVAVRY